MMVISICRIIISESVGEAAAAAPGSAGVPGLRVSVPGSAAAGKALTLSGLIPGSLAPTAPVT